MTMKQCAFEAQDHFQKAKRNLARTYECITQLHGFELDKDQSRAVLTGQAIIKELEFEIAKAHVDLQGLFVQLDEALAQEATRRR